MKPKLHIHCDGTVQWSINGQFHKEDGPAYISSEGFKEWWLCGNQLTELEHFNQSPHFQSLPDSERVFLRLKLS